MSIAIQLLDLEYLELFKLNKHLFDRCANRMQPETAWFEVHEEGYRIARFLGDGSNTRLVNAASSYLCQLFNNRRTNP